MMGLTSSARKKAMNSFKQRSSNVNDSIKMRQNSHYTFDAGDVEMKNVGKSYLSQGLGGYDEDDSVDLGTDRGH